MSEVASEAYGPDVHSIEKEAGQQVLEPCYVPYIADEKLLPFREELMLATALYEAPPDFNTRTGYDLRRIVEDQVGVNCENWIGAELGAPLVCSAEID